MLGDVKQDGTEPRLTSDSIDQELSIGWAVLQLEGNKAGLTGPSHVEWNTNSDTAVVRVAKGDQSVGNGGTGEGNEGGLEEHLKVLVYLRRCRESVTNVEVSN